MYHKRLERNLRRWAERFGRKLLHVIWWFFGG
jgi:hypothetical protein